MTNTTETENLCGLKSKDFQTTIDGKNTDLYILKNNVGNEIAITNYGGAIVAIMVPDKEGKLAARNVRGEQVREAILKIRK